MEILFVLAFFSASFTPYVVTVDAAIAISASGGHAILTTSTSGNNCNCDFNQEPVCGTDNKTYSNICLLKCVSNRNIRIGLPSIDVAYYGECDIESCVCPAVYQPVCGSDNQTYSNECEFDCENERRDRYGLPSIYIVYKDSCKQPICICSSDINPVCGTDNKTYKNVCVLVCISQLNQVKGRPGIGVRFFGACPVENCNCPLIVDPVCGTNEITYNNRYLLDCENRRHDHLGLPRVGVMYGGPCINCICSEEYKPVYASDKRTYANLCKLGCENKRRAMYGLPPLTSTNCECTCKCNKE